MYITHDSVDTPSTRYTVKKNSQVHREEHDHGCSCQLRIFINNEIDDILSKFDLRLQIIP